MTHVSVGKRTVPAAATVPAQPQRCHPLLRLTERWEHRRSELHRLLPMPGVCSQAPCRRNMHTSYETEVAPVCRHQPRQARPGHDSPHVCRALRRCSHKLCRLSAERKKNGQCGRHSMRRCASHHLCCRQQAPSQKPPVMLVVMASMPAAGIPQASRRPCGVTCLFRQRRSPWDPSTWIDTQVACPHEFPLEMQPQLLQRHT